MSAPEYVIAPEGGLVTGDWHEAKKRAEDFARTQNCPFIVYCVNQVLRVAPPSEVVE